MMTMRARDLIAEAERLLTNGGIPAGRTEARQLASAVAGRPVIDLFLDNPQVDQERVGRMQRLVAGRLCRIPLQHLIGTVDFMGYELAVGPQALIPRPETEQLVETVIDTVRSHRRFFGRSNVRILDIGTGSGNISIVLTKVLNPGTICALDLSAEALALAAYNARRQGVADRIFFVHEDIQRFSGEGYGPFDVIVSNPPYIPSAEIAQLEPEVLHDPLSALDGGADGLTVIRAVIACGARMLSPGGMLFLEIGCGQDTAVSSLAHQAFPGGHIEIVPDLQGIGRIVTIRTE